MLRIGTVLRGIYRIENFLSSGGFGNTYVATNVEFDERYAIKEFFMKGVTQRDDNQTTVSVSNSENENSFLQQKEKFKKEARRLRKLQNEHIVKVHDMFEENGTAYYVMDYVDGENLSERLKRTGKPMSEVEVQQLLPQILDALKTVHNEGFCHLDIKPSNIMLDKSGKVKLIDFGASKQLGTNGTLTTNAPTAFAQTLGYAPREQMEQNLDKIGPWTDIYALGATLYNLLTNKRPPLPSDIDDDISNDKHLALPMQRVSEGMKSLVLSLMQTNRMKRPQNASLIELSSFGTGKAEEDKYDETIVLGDNPASDTRDAGNDRNIYSYLSKENNKIKKNRIIVTIVIVGLAIASVILPNLAADLVEYVGNNYQKTNVDSEDIKTKSSAESFNNLNLKEINDDARIKFGAYVVEGVDKVIVLQPGQTMESYCRATLGSNMLCYFQALNDTNELKEGDSMKVPKIKLKPKEY